MCLEIRIKLEVITLTNFLNHLSNATNVAHTENGARAFATTNSSLLDFFSQGGALRNRSVNEKIRLFTKAFAEDNLLALKALFYFRDVIEGQGERQLFRDIIRYMANGPQRDALAKNLHLIPSFGRWDDLYSLDSTPLEAQAYSLMKAQYVADLKSENPSLLGKWLKSENSSSPITRKLAKKTRQNFGLASKDRKADMGLAGVYRKSLSSLRSRINILETQMSEKEWDEIDYSTVPSQAGLKYRQAFYRNDEVRYTDFIEAAKTGKVVIKDDKEVKVKINTKTLYPYQIVEKIFTGGMHRISNKMYGAVRDTNEGDVLDAMWNNLPDYFDGSSENSICVVDTSGSMSGQPLNVAVSLGIYAAERNAGAFKDHFITFSENPKLQKIEGSSIAEKVNNLSRAQWNMSTDIEKVFDLILNTAVANHSSQDELPTRIFIISDMEFNAAKRHHNDKALFQVIRDKFTANNYVMPNLVFWNVNARSAQFPMTMNEAGVQLVSGFSPTIFTGLMKNKMASAYELMLNVIDTERYSAVTV